MYKKIYSRAEQNIANRPHTSFRMEEQGEKPHPQFTEVGKLTKFEITSFENLRDELTDAQKAKIQENLKGGTLRYLAEYRPVMELLAVF